MNHPFTKQPKSCLKVLTLNSLLGVTLEVVPVIFQA